MLRKRITRYCLRVIKLYKFKETIFVLFFDGNQHQYSITNPGKSLKAYVCSSIKMYVRMYALTSPSKGGKFYRLSNSTINDIRKQEEISIKTSHFPALFLSFIMHHSVKIKII